jgi:hypothetical protein
MDWRPDVAQPAGSDFGQIWARFMAQGQKAGVNIKSNGSSTPSDPVAF